MVFFVYFSKVVADNADKVLSLTFFVNIFAETKKFRETVLVCSYGFVDKEV